MKHLLARRTFRAPIVVGIVALTVLVGMGPARPATDDNARVQWTTPDGPLRRPLDFRPFVASIDALAPARAAAVAAVADDGSLAEIRASLERGDFTSTELTTWYLQRIRTYDAGRYNAVLELNPDSLSIAAQLDAERSAGRVRGPMHGIPLLIKDNLSTGDAMHTTAGAAALVDHRTERDAFVVARLRDAGAVILGKSNMSEWAAGMDDRSPPGYSALGGFTRNPYGRFDVSGSSSGSAVAAAASFAAGTVGTETSGSIISPAKANNVVGLKPTLGLVSRDLVVPLTIAQDTPGPIARSVADVAEILTAMTSERDTADPASAEAASLVGHDFGADARRPADGLRVGVVGLGDGEVAALQRRFADAGFVIVPVEQAVIDEFVRRLAAKPPPDEDELFELGLKFGLDDFLDETNATGTAQSLAAITAFNGEAPKTRARYGQKHLLAALESTVTRDEWQRRSADARAIARGNIDSVFAPQQLDAVLDPVLNLDYAAAGYPALTVPAASKEGKAPKSHILIGDALSEPDLIAIAAAIERVEGRRAPILTRRPAPTRNPVSGSSNVRR